MVLSKKNINKRSRPTKRSHLCLQTDLGDLPKVLDRFERLASSRLPQKLYWECELALAESFTNVVRHAHRNLPASTPIDLEIALFPRRLEVRIWDFGQPFDWNGQVKARLQNNEDIWAVGGRGLRLIHQVMDRCQYIPARESRLIFRRRDRNCLILYKQLPQPSAQKSRLISLFERAVRKVERIFRKGTGLLIRKCSALVLK